MDDVLYSIITPVFNRADCIGRCIDSVVRNLNCGFRFEHIIVDDGSTDDTSNKVQEYSKKYPHIRFIRFTHNRGTNAARNAAIAVARSPWCIILDSDDYFVDDALKTISDVMTAKPKYKHYMFAPDDMQVVYANNEYLKGRGQKELTFFDFLSQKVSGDFIHVCSTDILRAHPFDEHLRIHEGVFFLMFFHDAQQMLFTNKVVTIRERSRGDSVTRETIRTNKKVISRIIKANELLLSTFRNDYEELDCTEQLNNVITSLYENYILAGKYDAAAKLESSIKHCSKRIHILKCVRTLHIGWTYRMLLSAYLSMKYNVLKQKLKQ